jgi:predicted transcriptional regulator
LEVLTVPTSDSDSPIPPLTARLVAAFVGNNSLPRAELPTFIETVHAGLAGMAAGVGVAAATEPPAPVPAVTVRKSITPDYLVCLDDGLKFKSLKRHLATLGMTAEQYRAKWGLRKDYPMVAPSYAAARSAMAKKIGLGQINRGGAGNSASAVESKRGHGRPRRALARAT